MNHDVKKILVIGATSKIAYETIKQYAKLGASLYLVARNPEKLESVCQDLKVRGVQNIFTYLADLIHYQLHHTILEDAKNKLGTIDIMLIAHGTLCDQKACEQSFEQTLTEYHNNFLSIVSLLTIAANIFEQQKQGTIAVISSVAGDRGRQSNYIYGSAKGALNTFLQGLNNRLFHHNVNVLTIKPGFVDTPMTAHLKKGPLFANADTVASGIIRAIEKKKDVVYLPSIWLIIMTIIRLVPTKIFKRLRM